MPKIAKEKKAETPELTPSLWRCHQCDALISIHSIGDIDLAICPICCDVTMDPLGDFETILGMSSS